MKTAPRYTWYILLVLIIVAFFLLTPKAALTEAFSQGEDPEAQCAQGVQSYFDDNRKDAIPLLEEGIANSTNAHFANKDDLGVCALVLGLIYNATGKNTESLEMDMIALNIFHESGNEEYVGITLNNIGRVYEAEGQYTKALNHYQQALTIMQRLENKVLQGVVLNNIGVVYDNQGKYTEALSFFQQALALARNEINKIGEAQTLNNMGLLYSHQGKYIEALNYYDEAVKIWLEEDDQASLGHTINNIGEAYRGQGLYTKALENYQQALSIAKTVDDKYNEGTAYNNFGLVYSALGKYTDALEQFRNALEVERETGDRLAEGATINNIGQVLVAQGRYSESLDYYQQALNIAREVKNRAGEGVTLSNIGAIYRIQGQYNQAIDYQQQALEIAKEIGNKTGEGQALNEIGLIYSVQERQTEALDYYQKVLDIVREINDQTGVGTILNNIGSVYGDQELFEEALHHYQQALLIHKQMGNKVEEGRTLNNIGNLYREQGLYKDAMNYFQKGLDIEQEIGNHAITSTILSNMGRTYELQSMPNEAIAYYEQAIAVDEAIRSVAGDETARASLIAQRIKNYNHAIGLYYRQQQYEKAFLLSEEGRARSFLDSLTTGYVELNDSEMSILIKNEQEAYLAQQAARDALVKAKSQSPSDEKLISELEVQFDQSKRNHQAMLNAITARGDRLAQLVPGRTKVANLEQAHALLDNKTTLLSFWVLEDQILAFILTRSSFDTISLPVEKTELYTQIKAFNDSFEYNTEVAYPESAIELYLALIEPLLPRLNTPNLVIVPHGELHYLPFAALTDGSEYLIDNFTISYLPSVSSWPYIRQNSEHNGGTPLILGNPSTNLKPLPYAESEAQAVASTLGTSPLLEQSATESIIQEQAANTSVLHLAAHGIYNSVNPLYSALYLTGDEQEDGALEVHEIYGLDLSKSEIVVLSACESQLGERSSGDELVGLTRAFFFAGAPSVMASLWEVNDKATQILMEKFYKYWDEGMSKAESLQQAQIEVRAEYPNPYYWAAFVLSGEGGKSEVGEFENSTPEPFSDQKKPNIPICGGSLVLIGVILTIAIQKKNKIG